MSFDSRTCYDAALEGHLKVLKYLKSEGVPFDEDTCNWAAEGGYLIVLQWLRSDEVDCPWDIERCLSEARRQNYTQVVNWIESFSE
jgi:hypothetical protein